MESNDPEILLFQSCRSLDGTIHRLQIGRRNGRSVALFHPSWTVHFGQRDEDLDARAAAIRKEISTDLTPIEQRTWEQLIAGKSIAEIAREEGVSRTAIYERVRGNSKAQGGMIAKNPYVAVWWYFRREKIL